MQAKTFIAVSAIALVALSACSQPAPAPEATATADAAAAAPAAPATWTPALPAPGVYEVSTSDGKPSATVTVNADNSYTSKPAQGLPVAGVVKLTDGKVCFDPSGAANAPECYVESVRAADGSFTATDDKGVVLNVKPKA